MKHLILSVVVLISLSTFGQHGHKKSGHENKTQTSDFKSERVSRTASFIANGSINEVFPLYGAFEERKWDKSWNPVLIYPEKEMMEEGTTFKVSGHGDESLWIVTKYNPNDYLVQYLVSTDDRFWTVTVKCKGIENDSKTKTTVTYTYTGLNSKGNHLNKKSAERMFRNELQDWADAINAYLK